MLLFRQGRVSMVSLAAEQMSSLMMNCVKQRQTQRKRFTGFLHLNRRHFPHLANGVRLALLSMIAVLNSSVALHANGLNRNSMRLAHEEAS